MEVQLYLGDVNEMIQIKEINDDSMRIMFILVSDVICTNCQNVYCSILHGL